MNVVVLNGSPKNEKSNTLKITNAFLDGINSVKSTNVDIIHINKQNIKHCAGYYSCWKDTPGKCILKDDMEELIEIYINADLVIWSFPIFNFLMPSNLKAFLDRLLPTDYPYIEVSSEGSSSHAGRFDLSHQKHILISSCGYHNIKDNYEPLIKMFDMHHNKDYTKIICPQGDLLNQPHFSNRVNEYLGYVKISGIEYIKTGSFSEATKNKLEELLYPVEEFVKLANSSWDEAATAKVNIPTEPKDYSLQFIHQMAALYNPEFYEKDIVLEMYFTDLNKRYQLLIKRNECTVLTEDFKEYTTRIETPFELWQDISAGKIDGSQAMMEKKYRIKGDLNNMFIMDTLFGDSEPTNTSKDSKKTNMMLLLFPFIVLWIGIPMDIFYGSIAGILVSALTLALTIKYKVTIYDKLSMISVTLLGVMGILSVNQIFIVCLSYLLFGGTWFGSTFTKIPLTAHYSVYSYGGEEAFENLLFMKTNKILTQAWGIVYIIAAIASYFLLNSSISNYTGLVNKIVPLIMGVFTVWFQKWYPIKVARG